MNNDYTLIVSHVTMHQFANVVYWTDRSTILATRNRPHYATLGR
jgi:hypothetical protein